MLNIQAKMRAGKTHRVQLDAPHPIAVSLGSNFHPDCTVICVSGELKNPICKLGRVVKSAANSKNRLEANR